MIILDDWQKEVLAYKGDMLLCTGRRVGKTYIMSRKAIDRMVEKKTNILIFSLTEEQSMIIIAMATNYLLTKSPNLYSKKKVDTNKRTLTLKNGSILRARPAGEYGDSGRGFDADIVIVDEASRMNKLFWISASPIILMNAGEIWLSSTPFGKKGYFWDRFNESVNLKLPEARFKVFYITTEEVIRTRKVTEKWTEEHRAKVLSLLEQDKRSMTKQQYAQEYLGLFLEDINQYFSDDLINQTCTLDRKAIPQADGDILMGCDIARFGGDEITYEFIRKDTDTSYYHIESIVKKDQDTATTEQEIIQYAKIYNAQKVGIDAGSGALGVGIYDRLMKDSFMKYKVVAMSNQTISLNRDGTDKQRILKEDMYENLKAMLERNELKLLNDEKVKQSLKSIQYELEDDEKGRIKVRIYGNYSHIVEGLIRAAYLAKKEKINKLFITYI